MWRYLGLCWKSYIFICAMLSAGHQLERNFMWLNKQFSGHLLCKTLWAVILVVSLCACLGLGCGTQAWWEYLCATVHCQLGYSRGCVSCVFIPWSLLPVLIKVLDFVMSSVPSWNHLSLELKGGKIHYQCATEGPQPKGQALLLSLMW